MLTRDEYNVLRMYALGAYNRGRRGNLIPYGLDEEDFVQECILMAIKNEHKASGYGGFDQFFRQIVKYNLKALTPTKEDKQEKLRKDGIEVYRRWIRVVNPQVSLSSGGASEDSNLEGDDYMDTLISNLEADDDATERYKDLIDLISKSTKVPQKAKEMLVLYADGYTLNEIGNRYAISKQRVKVLLDATTEKLRQEHQISMMDF